MLKLIFFQLFVGDYLIILSASRKLIFFNFELHILKKPVEFWYITSNNFIEVITGLSFRWKNVVTRAVFTVLSRIKTITTPITVLRPSSFCYFLNNFLLSVLEVIFRVILSLIDSLFGTKVSISAYVGCLSPKLPFETLSDLVIGADVSANFSSCVFWKTRFIIFRCFLSDSCLAISRKAFKFFR